MPRPFLKNNYPVLLAYFAIVACVGYVLLHHYKSDIHLVINSWVGNRFWDVFFKYITYLGDGVCVIIIGLVLMLLYSIRKGLFMLFSYTAASIFTTILKRGFYDDVNRPFYIFTYFRPEKLRLVDGAEILIHNSFPSGHSTAAFAMFFSFIYMSDRPWMKWLFFVMALLVAFSRTYLSQHWLIDIYVGSLIGVGFCTALYLLLYNKLFMQKLERPLMSSLIR